jgi:capsular exopolysaccharide synthesis family protein
MKDLTPIPPSDPGFQMLEPMANNHVPQTPKFRPQKFLIFLRKFWWIPLITLMLSTGSAVFIFFHTPPTFVSLGSLWETEKLRLPEGAAFNDDQGNSFERDQYLGTQAELLRSKMLRELTLNRMQALATNQNTLNRDGKDRDGNWIPVEIQVFSSAKSSVYTIEARSANPAFTTAYLNALMQQYLEYRKNVRHEVSSDTLASISEQVQRLERDMKIGQDALNEYERTNNFAVLQEERTVEASYLVKLKTELSDYQLEVKLLAARELEGNSGQAGATNDTDTIFDSLRNSGSPTASDSGRLDADKQIEMLKLQRETLGKYLRPKHPKMVKLDEDIARAQKLIDVYRQQNRDQIAAARQSLQIKIDSVEQFITEYETKVAAANELIAKADSLKQEVLRNQGLYDRLSALLQNVDISRNIDQETLAILEPAAPATRSYVEAKSMLTKAIMLGFVLGVGIIVLLALRDDRFTSLVEVTERFGDNVVGQVPEIPRRSDKEPLALLEADDERHMFAESYRNLRSALLYLAVDGRHPKVVLITSAVPNEGKSTVATNLARALALGGSKVLLVDADLRKGHIHELLKLKSKPGLSEFLRQPDDPGKYMQATDLEGFTFMPRGSVTRNPGDLFLSPAFGQMLARFREHYDYVLIDTSPVFAADDASTLAPKTDGTFFVVRNRFSHARVVREALEILFQRQARVLGLILNRSDSSARSYYAYKYAEYYASANNGEAEEDSPKT